MNVYSVKEVSKILKVNTNKVYDFIYSGLLPSIKLGEYKVTENSLEKFLEDYNGWDISNPYKPKRIEVKDGRER